MASNDTSYKKVKTKYIHFEEDDPNPKTSVWAVKLAKNGYIGEIRWYPRWRQYCWLIDDLAFSASCLDDLSNFIKGLMAERKNLSSEQSMIYKGEEKDE